MTIAEQGRPYQICARCVMDTSDPEIVFHDDGSCNHCEQYYTRIAAELPTATQRESQLERIVTRIREEGRGKDYDCIAGVSGGVDSTVVLSRLKDLGLRTLAVHFDNGWNSEIAVANIKSALDLLNIDLFTHVVDWNEFRDLQMSFIKAGVPNCEIPTDHGITATLVKTASKVGTRFVINGSNIATEGILPHSWVYYSHDHYHLRAIHQKFGTAKLVTFPSVTLQNFTLRVMSGRYKMVNLLNYIDYNKEQAIEHLKSNLGWKPYGAKHFESIYTRWYQGYYLVRRFGFDKRRAHFSALVCGGQMSRQSALDRLQVDPYAEGDWATDHEFVLKKFNMSGDQFEHLMKSPNRRHTDYPNLGRFIQGLSGLRSYIKNRAKSI